MKKSILSLVITMGLLVGTACAGLLGGASPIVSSSGSTSIAVGTDETIYTHSFSLFESNVFGVWLKATSATGTPDIKVELEEGYILPATEGSGDTNYVEPDGFGDVFAAITDEVAHIDTLAPVPMSFGRYKITGSASNPSDTVLSIYNFYQGDH